jgi:hypothetical protein
LQPRPVSSTNKSPLEEKLIFPATDFSLTDGVTLENECTISRKQINHRRGLIVEPRPGPNRKYSKVF